MTTPSLAQLHRAIKVSEQIEKLQAELASILGTSGASSTGKRKYTKRASTEESAAEPAKKKRMMSPEAREKIAAAQRKRWAKSNKEKKAKAKSEAAKAE